MVTAGGPAFTLVVTGRGFTETTRLTWDGAPLPARFDSDSRLVADVPASRIARSGTATIVAVRDKTVSDPLVFTINSALEWITPPTLPAATLREFYVQALTVAGGTPPVRFALTAGAIPPGLHLDGYNGSVIGYPSAPGAMDFTVRAQDASGASATHAMKLIVAAPLEIRSGPALPSATTGRPYEATIETAGGVPPLAEWTITSGALPKGLTFDAKAGRIAGTPTVSGAGAFTLRVRDSAGRTAARALTLLVSQPLSAESTLDPLGVFVIGDRVAVGLRAMGGSPPYTWRIADGSTLPDGLTLNAQEGVIRGTLLSARPGSTAAVARDSAGAEARTTFSWNISPGVRLLTGPPGQATIGVEFEAGVAATGGQPPYLIRIAEGRLPAGLQLAGPSVRGRPLEIGHFEVVLEALDTINRPGRARWEIDVSPAPLPSVMVALPDSLPISYQRPIELRLERPYPIDLEAELSIDFEPALPGPDDPAVLLSTGGRTARVRFSAGQTTGVPKLQLQTGTTAGFLGWRAGFILPESLAASGIAAPVELSRVEITGGPPEVRSVSIAATGASGLQVEIVALSPLRQLDAAIFSFDARNRVEIPLEKASAAWYASESSAPHGTLFVYRQPFAVSGDRSGLRGVSVVLRNRAGSSVPVTALLSN